MKIELEGQTVCVVGRLKGWTKGSIKAALEEVGGRLVGTPAEDGLILIGSNPAERKLTQARARACTFVEGDDVYTLLSEGVVEVEPPPVRSLDDLLGEARSILAQGPTRDGFAKLVVLLDDCTIDHLADLTDYLHPQLGSWGVAFERDDTSHRHAVRWRPGDVTGPCAEAAGAIRTMPKTWAADLIAGRHSPKHTICEALSFSGIEIPSTTASRIFDQSTLEHIRVLSLGCVNSSSELRKSFYERMSESTTFAHVETLVLTHWCEPSGLGLLLDHSECLPKLTRLDLVNCSNTLTDPSGRTYINAELTRTWAHQLETLRLAHVAQLGWLLDNPNALPHLEHLIVSDDASGYAHDSEWVAESSSLPTALRGCSRFTLSCRSAVTLDAILRAIGNDPPETLRVLDLSPNILETLVTSSTTRQITRTLTETTLASRLEKIVLNTAFPETAYAPLIDTGVQIDVVELH